jgi:hypothetical protein
MRMNDVLSMWAVPRSYKEKNGATESVLYGNLKRGLEHWKLKNLLEAVEDSRLEKGLAGAVVICELWRLAVAL